jgi:hypothetical protein
MLAPVKKPSPRSKRELRIMALLRIAACLLKLLQAVMRLVVIDHPFTKHLHRLKILKHNPFTTLCAGMAGHVVKLFAVCERSTCCF